MGQVRWGWKLVFLTYFPKSLKRYCFRGGNAPSGAGTHFRLFKNVNIIPKILVLTWAPADPFGFCQDLSGRQNIVKTVS